MNDKELYKKYQEELNNIKYAIFIMSFDSATICPKDDKERSYEVQNYFERKKLDIETSNEYYELLKRLSCDETLDEVSKISIQEELKEIEKKKNVPLNLLHKELSLLDKSVMDWQDSRENLNYDKFINDLDETVKCQKEIAKYKNSNLSELDVIIDEKEDDFSISKYDEFFSLIKKEILPLIKKILSLPKKYNEKIKDIKFDIDKQRHITKKLCDVMGYDDKKGCVLETIHPFSDSINVNDARVTTKYEEKLLFSNIYSVMHEIGHAIYELQIDEKYDNTILKQGTSNGIHESQSRFFENYIGRSKEFVTYFYPFIKEEFKDELKDFTLDDIYYYVNDVSNQPIRTEADELTYPIHILIRYEIEKGLFDGSIKAIDVSKEFNKRFKEYLGYEPKNMKEGCFQDIHWCSDFGYFPTYALGNAYAAQFLNAMEKDFDVFSDVSKGNLKNIREWLKNNIHKYGKTKKNLEIIKLSTKEEFNPNYYIEYLKNKFKTIYNL